jgi:tRNA nucleotidyltransferase (CCA-adding enzyme)
MNGKKKIFEEIEKHLMEDKKPSLYFEELIKLPIFAKVHPFTLISDLTNIPQSPLHHPEGSVWNHTLLVVDNAAERKKNSENSKVFMWSSLLHDLGKVPTTKIRHGKITSYDHDKWSEKLSAEFLREFTTDDDFIHEVSKMARWHMQILFVVKDLPYADIKGMLADVPLSEISLLSLCDRLGRGGMTDDKQREEQEDVRLFVEKCEEFLKKVCRI